ncbi:MULTISPECIES: hypothetical protein [Micromonospora]|uniref:Nucleotide-binding universal stress protein, UspA family n=1 Tax=Micromonospora solifontis TaxID=2487138 RepID=A0ABX9WCL1_9ACTN|nr:MULTISPECIES: hypothetical protein [Micromonospora]NES16990.1 hypothetical protein [Micromonospora sp. PPF5-17B]NES38403.1 hypothetical protein [Micromonospora solifontis]NES58729.1 hypothetical protein [Micromonospora sp. PPF5-6]RNL95818.1 hypothetical protein EFE23_19960 [Micromonospora solifontis]
MNHTIVGLDLDHGTVEVAEHWLHELVHRLGHPAGLIACTHLVHEPHPHVAVSLSATDPRQLADLPAGDAQATPGARRAAAEHRSRTAGRAIHYPGQEQLTGTLTVADVIRHSAIEQVVILGGAPATPGTVLHTLDYVRPQWREGRLTLVTRPAPGGSLAPFELQRSTPCCADH